MMVVTTNVSVRMETQGNTNATIGRMILQSIILEVSDWYMYFIIPYLP